MQAGIQAWASSICPGSTFDSCLCPPKTFSIITALNRSSFAAVIFVWQLNLRSLAFITTQSGIA